MTTKIKMKLASWKSKWLTYAGRLVKIKAILCSIPIFWMSVLWFPSNFIAQLQKIFRNFLWHGSSDQKKIHLVNWDIIYTDKCLGGLGIRKLRQMNISLLAKQIWRIYLNPNTHWAKIIRKKYLDTEDPFRIFNVADFPTGSPLWNSIWKARSYILPFLKWDIGDGIGRRFWEDSWLLDHPLQDPTSLQHLRYYLSKLLGREILRLLVMENTKWGANQELETSWSSPGGVDPCCQSPGLPPGQIQI